MPTARPIFSQSVMGANYTPEQVAERLRLSKSTMSSFLKGSVVTQELDASNDKDLSLLVASINEASVDKMYEFVEAERMHEIQAATLHAGTCDPADPMTGLEEMPLTEDMVKALLKNPFMSKDEAKRLKDGHKKGHGVKVYKEILAERIKAYWEKGLDGIVPYDGKDRSPAKDLKSANEAALELMTDPLIRGEFLVVPSKSENGSMHKIQWTIQKGNELAAPSLNHNIVIKRDAGFVNVTRGFYSGVDKDCSQIVTGCIPADPAGTKCAIFYINRTFSSAVSGFGGSTKRSIGRKMMKSKLVETFEKGQKVSKGL